MPISKDAFAKKMTKALRRAGVAQALRYDPQRFALTAEQGGEFFLASAHQIYRETSFWKRGAVLKHYARTMFNGPSFAIPKTFDEARAHLVPVIRNSAYLDSSRLLSQTSEQARKDSPEPHFEPLAGGLAFGLAYDLPQMLAIFSAQQLTDWGVTFEQAMKAARYNLSVRSREPLLQVAPGLHMAPWEDSNAAGRLLLTELLTRIPVKGELIAAVPGRDFLFVAGSEDPGALGAMIAAIEKAIAHPKPNTPALFKLNGTNWTPYELPQGHPLAARHRQLVAGFVASDYAEQKGLIEQLYEKSGVDRFVANFDVWRLENGEIFTLCTWGPCVSLLPRTELIAIAGADAETGQAVKPLFVKWDDAVAVVGHLMQRQDEYRLERYLVEQSPTAAEMAELRRRAVQP